MPLMYVCLQAEKFSLLLMLSLLYPEIEDCRQIGLCWRMVTIITNNNLQMISGFSV